MNIILCGFKCAGKTTLGQKVAHYYKQNFVDTDELMLAHHSAECNEQLNIGELYLKLGEKLFRKREQMIVKSLYGVENTVIALGGGTMLDQVGAQIIRELGVVVFLDVHPEDLWRRLCQRELPAYFPKTRQKEYFLRIYSERTSMYMKMANYSINCINIDNIMSFIGGIYES